MTSVAIAHDALATRGGAERVVIALATAFPDAPIHTLVHEPDSTFAELDNGRIATSWLNRIGPVRRNYRATMPVGALTFASTRIEADVVICSTAGLAHHVRCDGATLVYCHSPARWLHDAAGYMRGFGPATRVGASLLRPALSRLDRAAMRRGDRVLAISSHVRNEIARIYGLDATVLAPCSTLDIEAGRRRVDGLEPGFVLCPARALGYKRLDVLVGAARALPELTFVHVGDGPGRTALMHDAPDNLRSLGAVDDAELRWLYRHASLVALTWAEDFGLVPLEASAHGLTTVVPAARGFLDHPAEHLVGYQFASVDALVGAIRTAPAPTGVIDPQRLGLRPFIDGIRAEVDRLV